MEPKDWNDLLKNEIELFKAISFFVGGSLTAAYFVTKNKVQIYEYEITTIVFSGLLITFIVFASFLLISLSNIFKFKRKILNKRK